MQEQKIQDMLSSLTSNQGELNKKWEELQKQQQDHEQKIAKEKTELLQEK